MTIYHAVVNGDPLDSGGNGQVIEGNPRCTIEGPDGRHREQAYLGHKAWCAACQTVGVIAAGAGISEGLRGRDFTIGGAQEAVGGDIVVCNCDKHPRIISVYAQSCKFIDSAGPSLPYRSSAGTASDNGFDLRFQVINPRTGRPLGNMPYRIISEDGEESNGFTDEQGHTQLLQGTRALSATLHVLEELTPLCPNWDEML